MFFSLSFFCFIIIVISISNKMINNGDYDFILINDLFYFILFIKFFLMVYIYIF